MWINNIDIYELYHVWRIFKRPASTEKVDFSMFLTKTQSKPESQKKTTRQEESPEQKKEK